MGTLHAHFIKTNVTVCCHRKFPEAFFDISLLFKVSQGIYKNTERQILKNYHVFNNKMWKSICFEYSFEFSKEKTILKS